MYRILIVDDDEVTRVGLGSLLEAWGHQVAYAPNGDVALRLYKQGRFHMCIVDLFMPGKNGMETIRELREYDAAVQVIAITGMDYGLNLDVAKELGAAQTLTKPVDPNALEEAVRTAAAP
jgi:CheY-like chemotaxis protein